MGDASPEHQGAVKQPTMLAHFDRRVKRRSAAASSADSSKPLPASPKKVGAVAVAHAAQGRAHVEAKVETTEENGEATRAPCRADHICGARVHTASVM